MTTLKEMSRLHSEDRLHPTAISPSPANTPSGDFWAELRNHPTVEQAERLLPRTKLQRLLRAGKLSATRTHPVTGQAIPV